MAEAVKKDYKQYIHICIIIGIMVAAHFIPAPAPITPLGVQVIGIFIGMIWGWCTCGMLIPSILGIMMLGLTELGKTPEISLGMMLTHNIFVSSLVAFLLLAFVDQSGVMSVISQWLVTRKFAAGKPWLFMTFFFFALMLIAGLFNGIVLILLGFNFMGSLFKEMGYTKDDLLPTYTMLGIAIFAGIGTVWPPFLPNSLYTRGIITTALSGESLSTFQYFMVIDVPLIACFILYLLLGKFVLRVNTDKFVAGSNILLEKAEKEKITVTPQQKRGAIVLTLFIILLAIPALLPTSWAPIAFLQRLGLIGISTILILAILILKDENGEPLSTFSKLISGVSWDMLFLTGAIMVIAGSLTSEGTGIAKAMAMYVVPVVSRVSPLVFVVIVTVALCIFSQFSMNMVLQMVFAPILAPILVASGQNPLIAVMAVYFGTQLAFLAPSGSMMAAMTFGNTEWVKPANIYKIVVPWIIVSMIMFVFMSLYIPDMVYPM